MFNWFKKRFNEPTTFIGLGMLAQSAMILTKSNPQHIETVTSTIDQLSGPLSHGDTQGALMIALGGLLGFIMKEKASD